MVRFFVKTNNREYPIVLGEQKTETRHRVHFLTCFSLPGEYVYDTTDNQIHRVDVENETPYDIHSVTLGGEKQLTPLEQFKAMLHSQTPYNTKNEYWTPVKWFENVDEENGDIVIHLVNHFERWYFTKEGMFKGILSLHEQHKKETHA